jgi:hypothetical protein
MNYPTQTLQMQITIVLAAAESMPLFRDRGTKVNAARGAQTIIAARHPKNLPGQMVFLTQSGIMRALFSLDFPTVSIGGLP